MLALTSRIHLSQLEDSAEALTHFIQQHPKLMLLTGAGISTDSGIPAYRDAKGQWQHAAPVQHQAFMQQRSVRQRYWARSLLGWSVIRDAQPNAAHFHLSQLEQKGHVTCLVTQNVDRLHQKAGSHQVIDLHGRSDRVCCMSCGYSLSRDQQHQRCLQLNPALSLPNLKGRTKPDGDADWEEDFSHFQVADCPECGGILKPDVVFFGDNVPRERVEHAKQALHESDALGVIGSSLMVYSGLRFCRYARDLGKPLFILTQGVTRADDLAQLKLDTDIQATLTRTLAALPSL